jgi:hypothetical protein
MRLFDSLRNKIDNRRIRKGLERIASENAPYFKDISYSCSNPIAYLIGEIHTEKQHPIIATAILDTVRPAKLLDEGTAAPLSAKILTYGDALNKFKLTDYHGSITAALGAKLLDKPIPQLSEEENEAILKAFNHELKMDLEPFKANLQNMLDGCISNEDWQKANIIESAIYQLKSPNEVSIPDVVAGIRLIDKVSTAKAGLDMRLSAHNLLEELYYNSVMMSASANEITRDKERYGMLHYCKKNGIQVRPFDNQRAKRESYIGHCCQDRASSLTLQREQTMFKHLNKAIMSGNKIVTFGGRNHVRDSSSLMAELDRCGVGYCKILLKSPEHNFIHSLQYKIELELSCMKVTDSLHSH